MKIICIGRNYAEHAKELNNPLPEKPVFFMKPETSLLLRNRPFYYPDYSSDIHFETELVLKICRNGKHIQEEFAHRYYEEIGIGIDLTARDLQRECKKNGLPWEIAKAFDSSAPLGEFVPKEKLNLDDGIRFRLNINGETRQNGNSSDMIFSFDKIIAYVSQFVTLKMGDLIYTGTPEGVGPLKQGDLLEAFIEGEQLLRTRIK
jgi:2-keto-4-pentenoate hydratase/2-oxohepta-3-ene-1,7-dioic acid hydratase in catechol pathway